MNKTVTTTKKQLNWLNNRVRMLRAELASEYTRSLGAAAVNCVQEALAQAEAQLAAAK